MNAQIKEELSIQRMISIIGLFIVLASSSILDSFIDNPSYSNGISWFLLLVLGMSIIMYRENRLNEFVDSMENEE